MQFPINCLTKERPQNHWQHDGKADLTGQRKRYRERTIIALIFILHGVPLSLRYKRSRKPSESVTPRLV